MNERNHAAAVGAGEGERTMVRSGLPCLGAVVIATSVEKMGTFDCKPSNGLTFKTDLLHQ